MEVFRSHLSRPTQALQSLTSKQESLSRKYRTSSAPVEFYVTDYLGFLKEDFTEETLAKAFTEPDYFEFYKEAMEVWLKRRSFAFVSGCLWGDDWAWKLRTIKLDEVLAGKLGTPEEKFGYFVVSGSLPDQIREDYFFDDESSLELKTVTYWRLDEEGVPKSGKDYNEPPAHLSEKDERGSNGS